ncbi:methyl-accepting chemotaxis protein [Paenibacillus apis]|uniref:Methyl-accepting transducer domain-containing protein n=1 Tax=Paenibacillus apis TaxID=1792174 RepID=A0A919Y9V5_9BACL|nr:methyl-accepting chemotaxis protein [Paenibacillus apis]GIO45035.1 hypothetical protein J41TS4_47930 [Paenibacillus apis]
MANLTVMERPAVVVNVADFSRNVPVIRGDQKCSDVLNMFKRDSELPCLVICDQGERPRGLVMRDYFYRHLTGRFAPDLFYERPVRDFAQPEYAVYEISTPPGELLDHALHRTGHLFYDSLILTQDGKYYGVMTLQDLMLLSRKLQQEAEAERQNTLQRSVTLVEDIGRTVVQASEASERSLEETQQMSRLALEGREELEEVTEAFNRVKKVTLSQQNQVDELSSCSQDISRIAAQIRELAELSGILALNASIEASRAGEHGRGFAVVAEEVHRLAKETKQLSGNIEETLDRVGELVKATDQSMRVTSGELEQSQTHVVQAGDTFGQLVESVRRTERTGRESASATIQALKMTEMVNKELTALS